MENCDNEFLVNQIGALYWAAAIAHILRNDWDETQRLIGEADLCKNEVLHRLTTASTVTAAPGRSGVTEDTWRSRR